MTSAALPPGCSQKAVTARRRCRLHHARLASGLALRTSPKAASRAAAFRACFTPARRLFRCLAGVQSRLRLTALAAGAIHTFTITPASTSRRATPTLSVAASDRFSPPRIRRRRVFTCVTDNENSADSGKRRTVAPSLSPPFGAEPESSRAAVRCLVSEFVDHSRARLSCRWSCIYG